MKFEELYRRVYLTEQDEAPKEEAPKEEAGNETTEANPDQFKDDVAPMPQPAPEAPQAAATSGMTLLDYTNKLDELANLLINTEGDCLQKLVVSLEQPNTPFQGISGKSAEIARAAEALNDLSGRLKMYIISSARS
jgi:hypothetical protein